MFYAGGLADVLPYPSRLSYSFIRYWLSSRGSFGAAMQLLDLPYRVSDESLVQVIGARLVVDLDEMEKCMYGRGWFGGKYKEDGTKRFGVRLGELTKTLALTKKHLSWVLNQEKCLNQAIGWVGGVKTKVRKNEMEQIDGYLSKKVWPVFLAVDYWCEFFGLWLEKEAGADLMAVEEYVGHEVLKTSWAYKSIMDQNRVKARTLAWKEYLKRYGLRADVDLELACLRWWEQKEVIKSRIGKQKIWMPAKKTRSIDKRFGELADTVIGMRQLREKMRWKMAVWMDRLRQAVIEVAGKNEEIGRLCREELLENKKIESETDENEFVATIKQKEGKRIEYPEERGVSLGKITGEVRVIKSLGSRTRQGCVGVFANANAGLVPLYRKCSGIVFLQGGMDSIGLMIAREHGIPAVVDYGGNKLRNGYVVEVDGVGGKWKRVK